MPCLRTELEHILIDDRLSLFLGYLTKAQNSVNILVPLACEILC